VLHRKITCIFEQNLSSNDLYKFAIMQKLDYIMVYDVYFHPVYTCIHHP